MLKAKLFAGGGAETIYVDDVFSAYTYTGNGSTQTITNGIDLAGRGGMVWSKSRNAVSAGELRDSVRGTAILQSSTTAGQLAGASDVTAFNSSGYNLGFVSGTANQNATTYVSWTFRKAPKFFDVVTYTGTGTAGLTVSHSLGIKPGMIIVKRTDTTGNWAVYHQSIAAANGLQLETTSASFAASYWNSTEPTASQFTLGAPATAVNASGGTYVAYIFAHDTATDGIVQCGSFTTDGSGNATVSLGWEPQYLMAKASSTTLNWQVVDSSREFTVGNDNVLSPNTTTAEGATVVANPTATGFYATTTASQTYIYLAIRRPNKPPTVGTQVYNAIARTGTGAAATVTGVGFAPDVVWCKSRNNIIYGQAASRLIGATKALTMSTSAETTVATQVTAFGMEGMSLGTDASLEFNANTYTYINWFFKRAPGVFEHICYTGTGANKLETHGLGVSPELVIHRRRDSSGPWIVGSVNFAVDQYLGFSSDALNPYTPYFNSIRPTSTTVSVGTEAGINASGGTYNAYLFATKAGISKVGSYTGTATTKQIDCGFTTGARFVLIKRTDSAGDWYVWDTVRGIIAGNDPYLIHHGTAAEVTSTDYIDSYTSGFELSSTAPAAINASGGTYIYLAFA